MPGTGRIVGDVARGKQARYSVRNGAFLPRWSNSQVRVTGRKMVVSRRRGIRPAPPPRSTFPFCLDPEVEGDVAVVLWRALRDALWWARLDERDRTTFFPHPTQAVRERFDSVREVVPALDGALSTFLRVSEGSLERLDIAEACHAISEWADRSGYSATRALFAEAAAYADPEEPAWANLAARACRRNADYRRAEIWYERAFRLAVRARKKQQQVWAQLGFGTLMYALGRYDRARLWYGRAATRAARTNQPREAAEAEHDLMTVASEVGTYHQGARHLQRALVHYPVRHWRLPFLVHDFAYLLIQNRCYSAALPLLQKLADVIPRSEQLLLWSAIARAAAGAGDADEYEHALAQAGQVASLRPEYSPAALRNLAEAALLRHDWQLAADTARQALDLARVRDEFDIQRSAKEILRRAARQEAPSPEGSPDASIADLSRELLRRLARWQAPGRGRPGTPRRER